MGRLLLNDALPPSHQITNAVGKKELNTMLTDLARNDPQRYVKAVGDLKRVGDAVATDVGYTVGLDDIEPHYAKRDAILQPALAQIKKTRDPTARRKLIHDTQAKLLTHTKTHPGQMRDMAASGSRGNPAQMMKSVSSPVGVSDDDGDTVPWMISKGYSEGLKPVDNWIAIAEARRNAIESFTSVAAPGEMSKILVNNMSDQLITMNDCGTKNGVQVPVTDAIDRYTVTGTLFTPRDARLGTYARGQVHVRSPMTCEAPDGICQKCYGLNTRGHRPSIGTNAGMIAAHAMGEPLTQLSLSAKHGARTVGSQKAVLQGLSGLKQLTEIPQSFFHKATLAGQPGTVTKVKRAPQGGNYVYVQQQEHYVPPNLDVLVKPGSEVEAGDALSDGIPKPDEVVKHKGLGAGRQYLVDQLQGIYQRQGVDLDRKHLEILAKTDLNYVKIMDKDSPAFGVMRGDIVDYNRFRNIVASKPTRNVSTAKAVGQTLGKDALHYTVGTQVTPTIARDLKRGGLNNVAVSEYVPQHEPVMKPITRTPLLHPDWLAKMGHRNLKNVIQDGAAFGEMSDIHGSHPVPAFVFGEEFGTGPRGKY
jgi:DNA-directed RNA polymerase subunit beta'